MGDSIWSDNVCDIFWNCDNVSKRRSQCRGNDSDVVCNVLERNDRRNDWIVEEREYTYNATKLINDYGTILFGYEISNKKAAS